MNHNSGTGPGSNLVARVSDELRQAILNGQIAVGDKLPSEARLTEQYAVSRTVVREAIASLRSDGLVRPRQGSGVYVISNQAPNNQPFMLTDNQKISSVLELLELRTAIEVEAAGLAAQRRSPAQEEAILEALYAVEQQINRQRPAAEADMRFHLAIADATNNPRFHEFLQLMGRNIIPRHMLREGRELSPSAGQLPGTDSAGTSPDCRCHQQPGCGGCPGCNAQSPAGQSAALPAGVAAKIVICHTSC
ncbi:MAG: FadR/GntR family transcriptional regulator [Thiolinea sp.]